MNNNVSKEYMRSKIFKQDNEIHEAIMPEHFKKMPIIVTSDFAKKMVAADYTGSKKSLINFAFRHKEFLKKIPYFGKKLISKKNSMLNRVRMDMSSIKDVSPLFLLHNDDFMGEIYKELLGRFIDLETLNCCMQMLKYGASKGVIVYSIAISEEFNNRCKILNIEQYKKQYKKYIFKQKLNRIPIFNRIIPIFTIRSQMNLLHEAIGQSEYYIKRSMNENNTQIQKEILEIKSEIAVVKYTHEQILHHVNLLHDEVKQGECSIKRSINDNHAQLLKESSIIREEITVNRAATEKVVAKQCVQLAQIEQSLSAQGRNLSALQQSFSGQEESLSTQEQSLLAIKEDISEYKHNFSLLQQSNSSVRDQLQGLSESINLSLSISTSISEKVDSANIMRDSLSFMVKEIPDRYHSNGAINEKSYLQFATKDVNHEEIKGFSEKDKFYYYLANLSRGSKSFVQESQQNYVEYVKNAYGLCKQKLVVDVGSGRGEFLELMHLNNISAIGIDSNPASANIAMQNGFKVVVDTVQNYMMDIENNSLSAITMFQVAEHIPFDEMFDLCHVFAEKIGDNGCFIMETINPFCFSKFGSFKIDPSHIEFPSPDAFKLLCEMCGFSNVELHFYAPVGNGIKSENMLSNYEGYCLIATK